MVRYLSRRISSAPAVLLLVYRDDDVDAAHPLRPVLGAMPGSSTLRLRLPPLSAGAVSELAGDAEVDVPELHRTSGGNPFYVTEVLATPDVEIPPTVVDAVLGRLGTLGDRARGAVERCAVVPNGVELGLLRALHADLDAVAEAEQAGILALRGQRMAFRHELARRVVAASLPAGTRIALHLDVVRCLLAGHDPDPFRVLHHATEAGADDVVVEFGRRAAREAHRAGAFEQEAACYAAVLEHAEALPAQERAALDEAYAWALSTSNHPLAAAGVALRAVEQWQQSGEEGRAVGALVVLSRQQFLTEQPAAALASARRALDHAALQGETAGHALALANLGHMLVVLDREEEGLEVLDASLPLIEKVGGPGVRSLSRTYVGSAHLQLGLVEGRGELLHAIEIARAHDSHEAAMRGYYNLVEGCWRLGRFDEALDFVDRAEAYGARSRLDVYSYMIDARRFRMMALRGRWSEAVAGLLEMVDGRTDPGMIGRETLPVLARLLVRTADPDAEELLAVASLHAQRADVLEWLVPTGLAVIERAWLRGTRSWPATTPLCSWSARSVQACNGSAARSCAISRGWASEAAVRRVPRAFAAGLRGDWQRAAAGWEAVGDPYERALELAESGEPAATVGSYRVLESLGAVPATRLVRTRMRELGIARAPRRPGPDTR